MIFVFNNDPLRLSRTSRIGEASWDQLIALLGSWSFVDDELVVWAVATLPELKVIRIGRFEVRAVSGPPRAS